jgi:hypothetical protein
MRVGAFVGANDGFAVCTEGLILLVVVGVLVTGAELTGAAVGDMLDGV